MGHNMVKNKEGTRCYQSNGTHVSIFRISEEVIVKTIYARVVTLQSGIEGGGNKRGIGKKSEIK